MQSFDDDRESGGSQDGSSDDEQTGRLNQTNDADEGDGEDENEGEGEGDDDEDEGDGDGEDGDDDGDEDRTGDADESPEKAKAGPKTDAPSSLGETPNLPPNGQAGPKVTLTSPSPQPAADDQKPAATRITIREEALTAKVYDIVPTIAAPQSTSINVVTSTPDLRWVFSGGSDGYIRRFNWLDTANSKLMLTVAQRHPFVDSVTKAGVLVSYWENEEPQARDDGSSLSPVYSLAVQNQALWLLSGLESGGINLQSVRHEEGKRIHLLKQHTSAVSVLNLAQDERSVLSGSWDKTVLDWDLDTGNIKRKFLDGAGQISALEMRPLSSLPVPETAPVPVSNGTFSSNNDAKPRPGSGGGEVNGVKDDADGDADANENNAPSPVDSLFGGGDDDDLFGENNDIAPPVGLGEEDNDLFGENNDIAPPVGLDGDEPGDAVGDISMADASSAAVDGPSGTNGTTGVSPSAGVQPKVEDTDAMDGVVPYGLPHSTLDEDGTQTKVEDSDNVTAVTEDRPLTADTTFLAASIDGTIRIWDKRQSTPVAKIVPRNTPPWCMGACWSPDGNYIYAGRRNGSVEEFSLHKGFKSAERTFRFPNGSGPVSAVRAMPNGRHLICASYDILRLYDLQHSAANKAHSSVPFLIVPGHRTGVISQLFLDPSCRFMISAAGTRGWEGNSTQVMLGYEIVCQ